MTPPRYPDLAVAPLRWWHLPAVTLLEAQLFAGDSPWTEAMFWSELAQGHTYLGVWDGAELLAYAGLAVHPDGADVQTIGVQPRHQGAGIGRRLMTELLTAAGHRDIHLEVRTDNEPAIGLYRSFGFQIRGTRRRYYQPSGADAYTMVRTR
jgi:ribosomal-protein-alanine N-acetyltransferase